MKKIYISALIIGLFGINSLMIAHLDPYNAINPAQEKMRIVLKQLHVTYNWLDPLYAARERYYLSGIGLDYVRELRKKCTTHKECHALFQKLERIFEKLHVLDLNLKEFEKIQCEAQPLIQLPLFATKPTPLTVA